MDKYSHGPPDSDFMELGGASRDDDTVQWLAEIGWRHTSQWSTLNDSWNYSVDLLPAQSCPLLSSLSDSDTHRLDSSYCCDVRKNFTINNFDKRSRTQKNKAQSPPLLTRASETFNGKLQPKGAMVTMESIQETTIALSNDTVAYPLRPPLPQTGGPKFTQDHFATRAATWRFCPWPRNTHSGSELYGHKLNKLLIHWNNNLQSERRRQGLQENLPGRPQGL